MREIKFRGQKKDGTWVYGDLVQPTKMTVGKSKNINDQYALIVESSFVNGGYASFGRKHWVKKETLGQFTELLDKNGKEVYEHDKIKRLVWSEKKFKETKDGAYYEEYVVKWIEDLGLWGFLVNGKYFLGQDLYEIKNDFEVIGTIHDKEMENE